MKNANSEQISGSPDGKPLASQPRWRQDFPIDWSQDEYISRRDFTKFMVLTSFAFVAGQVWILLLNFRRVQQGKPPVREIARVADVPVGGFVPFAYPTEHDPCILTRLDETTFVAYNRQCTHLSCPVFPKPAEGRLFCPCHEGAFDLASGRPIGGPPRRPLPLIKLEIRDGRIFATDVEVRTI